MTLEKLTEVSLRKEIDMHNMAVGEYSLLKDDIERDKLFVLRVEEIIINRYNRYFSIGRQGNKSSQLDQGSDSNKQVTKDTVKE